jgi:hypothetical protein
MRNKNHRSLRHEHLETAKWIAIVAMTIDHYGKIFDPPWYLATHITGRIAFPLFAWIIGTRLALSPGLATRYLRRLLPWAVVSQPIYVLVGHDWWQGNILITLALGVGVHIAFQSISEGSRARGYATLVLLLLPSPLVDFELFGVLSVPLIAGACARRPGTGAAVAGPLGVLANASLSPPFLTLTDWAALLATPAALLTMRTGLRLPRLPTPLFYGYYPLHLLLLHLVEVLS